MQSRLLKVVLRGLEHFLVALLLVTVLIVFLNVIGRFAFGEAFTWADEVARFTFIWLTFLGAAVGVARGSHIGMDLVVSKVSPSTRLAVEAVSHLLVIAFLLVWGFYGWQLVEQNTGYLAPATGVPMGWVYAVGPIAALLMAVIHIIQLKNMLFPPTKPNEY